MVGELSTPSVTSTSLPPKAKLLVAASGTGGHLFPAIATAQQLAEQPLADYEIEWLGEPGR